MTSIYRAALGDDFDLLHPRLQWRFGFSSIDETCQIGTGVMDEVWRGPWWTLPFLLLGSTRRVLFPSRGRAVPFTIANYAYVDLFGRETVTWARRFWFGRRRRAFDATMVHSKARGTIVDDHALIAALRSGKLFAAGLDVYENEPRIHPDYRTLPNVFLLPHLGSATVETRNGMGFKCLDNLDAVFAGRDPSDRLT